MAYVAYTELGPGVPPGTNVDPDSYDPEQWEYLVLHGNVVVQGSENDPNILAARSAGEDYVDPRDQKIAELEAKLATLQGDSADTEETAPVDSDQLDAQAKVDQEQAQQTSAKPAS
jgi:hypothetical protein